MGTVYQQLVSADQVICLSIEKLNDQRGLLSQHILAQLTEYLRTGIAFALGVIIALLFCHLIYKTRCAFRKQLLLDG